MTPFSCAASRPSAICLAIASASSTGKRTLRDPVSRKRRALDEFQDDPARVRRLFEAVHGGDVRMVQRGEDFGFTLEARDAIGIRANAGGQDLDGDVALQARIAGAIDLTHAASAEHEIDFVGAEARTALEGHCLRIVYATAQLGGQSGVVRVATVAVW